MAHKRLVIDLTETEHASLTQQARRAGQTVSNYVRSHLGMDPRQQGVKHQEKRRARERKILVRVVPERAEPKVATVVVAKVTAKKARK